METPKQPDEQGSDQPPSSDPPPPPPGPQAPVGPPGAPPPSPGQPYAPSPPAQAPGPQAPGPPPPPGGPYAPPGGPYAPPSGPYAPPGPEGPPSYGGPVPPGGWQQPIPQAPGWHGTPLASWGSRVAAYLIDLLILLVPVIFLIVVVVAIAAGSDTGAAVTAVIGFLAYLVIAFIYAPLLMAREGEHNGQTWGRQAVGIRVVRDTGEVMGFGWAALREIVVKQILFGWVGSLFFGLPALLDFLWPLWDDQNRALHDMIVSTHVVQA